MVFLFGMAFQIQGSNRLSSLSQNLHDLLPFGHGADGAFFGGDEIGSGVGEAEHLGQLRLRQMFRTL